MKFFTIVFFTLVAVTAHAGIEVQVTPIGIIELVQEKGSVETNGTATNYVAKTTSGYPFVVMASGTHEFISAEATMDTDSSSVQYTWKINGVLQTWIDEKIDGEWVAKHMVYGDTLVARTEALDSIRESDGLKPVEVRLQSMYRDMTWVALSQME